MNARQDQLHCKLKKWSDDVLLIEFDGSIEMDTATSFRQHLKGVIDRKPRAIALDLGRIDYMDSSGVAVMIEALRWCRPANIRFLLVGPSAAVSRAKAVVHLDNAFETAPDRDAAWRIFVDEKLLASE